jgi:hypothetical protein
MGAFCKANVIFLLFVCKNRGLQKVDTKYKLRCTIFKYDFLKLIQPFVTTCLPVGRVFLNQLVVLRWAKSFLWSLYPNKYNTIALAKSFSLRSGLGQCLVFSVQCSEFVIQLSFRLLDYLTVILFGE